MAYRGDVEALRTRHEELERELGDLRARAAELGDVKRRVAEVERQLSDTKRLLDGWGMRRALPVLDDVRIASPCGARWDDMVGDERVRFCGSCEKNVYNLSAMTRAAAEALLREKEGSLCARVYRRADGTVITADCAVGVRKKRVRRAVGAAVGGGMLAALAGFGASTRTQGQVTMGDVATPTMGSVAAPAPPPPTANVHPEPKVNPSSRGPVRR